MYSIKELAISTRLSDRTLRNYLEAGILQGDKSSGMWLFTDEQINDFLRNDAVRSTIQAKNRALVNDFMADTRKKENAACIILDLPEVNAVALMHFICHAVEGKDSVTMSFEKNETKTRIILHGKEKEVWEIMTAYHNLFY